MSLLAELQEEEGETCFYKYAAPDGARREMIEVGSSINVALVREFKSISLY